MMRIGVDGRKIPEAERRGPIASFDHARDLGLGGLFFRTLLDMTPTLDVGFLKELRAHADGLGLYVETGLGKVNPYAAPETPELRAVGDGDTVLGFRRMMEAAAAIDCRELWVGTANYKPAYHGRLAYDRFRTDVTWSDQLAATEKFLKVLAPIARDLGIHMNVETHEEITTFEVVRLVEAVGPDVAGVTFDVVNPLQRGEHPVWAARRVAPYVRQTHMKDAHLAFGPGGLLLQQRPCGEGVIEFAAILPLLAAVKPDLNLSIENSPAAPAGVQSRRRHTIEVDDPAWLAAHPDLTLEEYAAYLALVRAYEARIAAGDAVDWETWAARPYGVAEAEALITAGAAHLCATCRALAIAVEDRP